MLYVASEIVVFLVGAFLLGWWFGQRKSARNSSDVTETTGVGSSADPSQKEHL